MRKIGLTGLFIWLVSVACQVGSVAQSTPSEEPGTARAAIFIERTELLIMESFPVQIRLQVSGLLPTPCHRLEWQVASDDTRGTIEVEAFAVPTSDPAEGCVQVEEPFEVGIPLGDYSSGAYAVYLNGERVGDFDLGSDLEEGEVLGPGIADRPESAGPIYVDQASIKFSEGKPDLIELRLVGALPTPCHRLGWAFQGPGENGTIQVEVWSTTHTELDCIQVLEPLDITLHIPAPGGGTFRIFLNGEFMGELER